MKCAMTSPYLQSQTWLITDTTKEKLEDEGHMLGTITKLGQDPS